MSDPVFDPTLSFSIRFCRDVVYTVITITVSSTQLARSELIQIFETSFYYICIIIHCSSTDMSTTMYRYRYRQSYLKDQNGCYSVHEPRQAAVQCL